jgi:hypothetical protein
MWTATTMTSEEFAVRATRLSGTEASFGPGLSSNAVPAVGVADGAGRFGAANDIE